jgi:hypothetical protein
MKLQTLTESRELENALAPALKKGVEDMDTLLRAIIQAEQADSEYAYALELGLLKNQASDLRETIEHTLRML